MFGLLFSTCLLLAVLLSGLAGRSILSISVLFLLAGFGASAAGLVNMASHADMVERFADYALVAVLFTDALKVGVRDLASAWHLPGRALLVGMPLTVAFAAATGRWIVGLSWPEALLVGSALAPTDPVFAAALVNSPRVPQRLRFLLNVESGLNDGLASPLVLLCLLWLGAGDGGVFTILGELGLGVLIGVAIPALAIYLETTRLFGAVGAYRPLFGLGIGLVVLALCKVTDANEFLGAFAAGVTVASMSRQVRDHFNPLGEPLAELFKCAAVLLLGASLTVHWLASVPATHVIFALVTFLAVRPAALLLALLWSRLSWRERLTAAWFGPKGFASVVFALLILHSGLQAGRDLARLIALAVVASILVHSSTDVLIARRFGAGTSGDAGPEEP